jgi:hypothetical protein
MSDVGKLLSDNTHWVQKHPSAVSESSPLQGRVICAQNETPATVDSRA